MIAQREDQRDVPTLVGQALEAAQVWDRLVKPARGELCDGACPGRGTSQVASQSAPPGLLCLQTTPSAEPREALSPGSGKAGRRSRPATPELK